MFNLGEKNDQIPFNLKAVCKSTLKICLEKIVDQTEKSGKVGLEIINAEVQIIMPSGTLGAQPWIYIFTASSLPSIGSEGPGFQRTLDDARLRKHLSPSYTQSHTVELIDLDSKFFCQIQHLRETMKVSNLT